MHEKAVRVWPLLSMHARGSCRYSLHMEEHLLSISREASTSSRRYLPRHVPVAFPWRSWGRFHAGNTSASTPKLDPAAADIDCTSESMSLRSGLADA
jgi:hypothetical protein